MPHKLRDCTTKDVDRSEMFIVEGDSAGGSATQGRDVETQAILPLRGKLLNVEKARLDKILAFEEIRTLISALKCGIGPDFDISKLRYGRVIIMTDADVDGSHIRTLLLTFFFRQMPELIRRGRIYIAQPPLYLIARGKKEQYVLNEREMSDVLVDLGLDGASLLIRDINEAKPGVDPPITRTLEGEELVGAVKLLRRLAELAEVVERRGVRFLDLLASRDDDPDGQSRLPVYRITWLGGEAPAWSEDQVEQIIKEHKLHRPDIAEQAVDGDADPEAVASRSQRNGSGGGLGSASIAVVRELHENKELAVVFERLAALGIDIDDYGLTTEEAVTGERLPTKYAWVTPHKGRAKKQADTDADNANEDAMEEAVETVGGPEGKLVPAAGVPHILQALFDVGRRGMEVKRFKGLGEMDPEQLWETTMDPDKRTLLRVAWDDASAADELFTILMGENVENRRNYIEQHALEVKQLDV
jgi:DNA gyrase subunit B